MFNNINNVGYLDTYIHVSGSCKHLQSGKFWQEKLKLGFIELLLVQHIGYRILRILVGRLSKLTLIKVSQEIDICRKYAFE